MRQLHQRRCARVRQELLGEIATDLGGDLVAISQRPITHADAAGATRHQLADEILDTSPSGIPEPLHATRDGTIERVEQLALAGVDDCCNVAPTLANEKRQQVEIIYS